MSQPETQAVFILNTRPLPMGAALTEQLTQQGYQSQNYPQITTEAVEPDNLNLVPQQLSQSDRVWIFVSRTAVRFFFQVLSSDLGFAPKGRVVAVGPGTKQELVKRFPELDIHLPEFANSESLVQMPILQQAKAVSLVKGFGGRDLIENNLTGRGVAVCCYQVYTRLNKSYPLAEVKKWQDAHILLATSVDIAQALVENIHTLSLQERAAFFQNKRWVVLSERIKQYLLTKGIPSDAIFICEDADNSSIIKTITTIVK